MIIGHLPAAYILSRHLQGRLTPEPGVTAKKVAAGMLGGVFPDLDMFYYHLVDQGQHHHHSYWSHYPLVWLSLVACTLFWWRRHRDHWPAAAMVLFTLNGFVHLCLDTALGQIRWLAPFVDLPLTLFELTARYDPWWFNFLLSPTFLVELFLLGWAMLLFIEKDKAPLLGWLKSVAPSAGMLLRLRKR